MIVYAVDLYVLTNTFISNCNNFRVCTDLTLRADSVGDPNAFVENADGCILLQLASLFTV